MINPVRLAERWREANAIRYAWPPLSARKPSQDDTQLVTRADLRASVAELRAEMNDLKAWMLNSLMAMFGIALAIIGLIIRFLTPTTGLQ